MPRSPCPVPPSSPFLLPHRRHRRTRCRRRRFGLSESGRLTRGDRVRVDGRRRSDIERRRWRPLRGAAGERRGRGVGPALDGALGAGSSASSATRIRRTRCCASASSAAPAGAAGRLVPRQRRRTARLVPRPSSARPQVRPRGDWRAASTAFGRIDAGRRGARRWPAVARCAERRRAPPLEVASRAQRHGPAASAAYGAWPLLSVPKALCLARRLPKTVSAEMGALPRQRFGRVGSFDVEAPDVPDIGGCDIQKQEIQEAVELPLTHHELYCSMVLQALARPCLLKRWHITLLLLVQSLCRRT
ncbi:uncharacterized protein LOC125535484 isoform X1 [Triticum urartu]|uniref:uncharacterized protein LOC125535484 isoform X1 n=1 Tax=Triticum urartu TaxID=4572 RepID=UPI00204333A2|nr:uncharacterized protein LOC125535484 isoform X1 [Triticum urartu]XP_048554495.1 uncharacterized protein LOC125535484 isoform X1 [Triticum urartu]XP_048554496.1 uncharacterized protein LOC125535484 isoform X1 [Triticum urartu]XP_048554497.1 uncharacterized protein LOC125535484 isoform X1 [Triticum urartu]XP_048554498.1 uncharacterized protein LOC125535484 isoform X1 [Triticum urartu]XP_048554499.1 uncharacterized protein LOC125535484 isoform X1 [Triticum urartu]XP_048554500.1 uncharacterize